MSPLAGCDPGDHMPTPEDQNLRRPWLHRCDLPSLSRWEPLFRDSSASETGTHTRAGALRVGATKQHQVKLKPGA